MPKKLSDREMMVYLRNAALALAEFAREKGIKIQIYADETGYTDVRAGDYEHIKHEDGGERYAYTPLDEVYNWRDINPSQIIGLTQPPKEIPDSGNAREKETLDGK